MRGVTLLEVIVYMAILSGVVLGLVATLQGFFLQTHLLHERVVVLVEHIISKDIASKGVFIKFEI